MRPHRRSSSRRSTRDMPTAASAQAMRAPAALSTAFDRNAGQLGPRSYWTPWACQAATCSASRSAGWSRSNWRSIVPPSRPSGPRGDRATLATNDASLCRYRPKLRDRRALNSLHSCHSRLSGQGRVLPIADAVADGRLPGGLQTLVPQTAGMRGTAASDDHVLTRRDLHSLNVIG